MQPARWAIHALMLAAVAVLCFGGAVGAQGDVATSAAGVIVDTGDGEPIEVVVTFAGEETTALEALRRAELDVVTVAFGGLGEAVCEIADTGCDVGACRQRVCQTGDPDSPFWQYWEQHDGEWTLSQRGASHATLGDGEIAAWVWTGPAPELGPIAWETLAERAGAPEAVAAGKISGQPAVYHSGKIAPDDEGGASETLVAAGVIALVGVLGGWLVIRQRRGGAMAA